MMRHCDATDLEAEVNSGQDSTDPYDQAQVKTDIGWAFDEDFISDGQGSDDDEPWTNIDDYQGDELYDDSDRELQPQSPAGSQRLTQKAATQQQNKSLAATNKRAADALATFGAKRARRGGSQE